MPCVENRALRDFATFDSYDSTDTIQQPIKCFPKNVKFVDDGVWYVIGLFFLDIGMNRTSQTRILNIESTSTHAHNSKTTPSPLRIRIDSSKNPQ